MEERLVCVSFQSWSWPLRSKQLRTAQLVPTFLDIHCQKLCSIKSEGKCKKYTVHLGKLTNVVVFYWFFISTSSYYCVWNSFLYNIIIPIPKKVSSNIFTAFRHLTISITSHAEGSQRSRPVSRFNLEEKCGTCTQLERLRVYGYKLLSDTLVYHYTALKSTEVRWRAVAIYKERAEQIGQTQTSCREWGENVCFHLTLG